MKKIFTFASAVLLMASSANAQDNGLLDRFKALPLAENTQYKDLAAQIAANPSEWQAAYDFLTGTDLKALTLGRHDLTDAGTYANVQEYDTKTSGKYEAHRKYIDIQYVVKGEELIYVANVKKTRRLCQEYSEDGDAALWMKAKHPQAVKADLAHMVILFPQEAHMPGMTRNLENDSVRKIVVKIPYVKKGR